MITASSIDTAALDRHLAEMLLRITGTADAEVEAVLCRLSASTASGNVCIDLRDDAPEGERELETLRQRLLDSGIAGAPEARRPLVLDARDRLYLYRYWAYERRLAEDLRARAASTMDDVDPARLRPILDRLFPAAAEEWQKVAAAIAALKRLCVLSGGPGTGKTTTVVRVLALLCELHAHERIRIALAAPTGKAAARMQEALRAARAGLHIDEAARLRIPETATTLHRLLGGTPESLHFRHDATHPLPLDVLVVDEASMIDTALMAKLVAALPAEARLLLVGDKDQLASVEPGAVLGNICAADNAYTPAFVSTIEAATGVEVPVDSTSRSPLRDAVVLLAHSYRFGADTGIGRLAHAVRRGDAEAALGLLHDAAADDVQWDPAITDARSVLVHSASQLDRYAEAVREAGDVTSVFATFGAFRVLAAHRHGAAGVQAINASMERYLATRLQQGAARSWFRGRAVMVNRNHHALRLFNGDVGIALDANGGLRVVFPGNDGELRRFAPSRLPQHEPAYALTVHKAQGSEFDEVLLLLPDAQSPLLTRELMYTAITRARRRVIIGASEAALRTAITRQTLRTSGLRDACWHNSP